VEYAFISLALGAAALVYAAYAAWQLEKYPEGTERMREIGGYISEGADAFLRKELKVVVITAILLSLLSGVLIGWQNGMSLAVGALSSAAAGYVGIKTSVRANVRVAAQAVGGGIDRAFAVAFKGGTVMGFFVTGIALIGISALYLWFGDPVLMVGYMFGASLVSLFLRVGGGIFTKGADIGSDLVGKMEQNIPEDDERNPGVIADNVGDNVGDCAGMGADLFETYAVTLITAMLLARMLPGIARLLGPAAEGLPLIIGGMAVLATLVGIPFVRLSSKWVMGAFYKGLSASALSAIVLDYLVVNGLPYMGGILVALVTGITILVAMYVFAEYFTSDKFKPVQTVAKKSQGGAAINIISGLANGLKSTAIPVLVVAIGILVILFANGAISSFSPNFNFGVYAISLAATSMMSLAGMVISIDTFGPISDNAGGIAEMAKLPKEVRDQVTDPLDAAGNTTKATTKAYAIGSAALATLSLFVAFDLELPTGMLRQLLIYNPLVLIGLFLGAMVPFLFTSLLMEAVGIAADGVVSEIRRQFKELNILGGGGHPDYAATVGITTGVALKELTAPALLAVGGPLAVGFILGPLSLSGYMVGSIVTGFPMAVWMTTGGGAWDNAKKFVEKGMLGGKGSDIHRATVVGDTVGDAVKDTAGPAVNPLIKVIMTVSVLFVPLMLLLR